MNQDLYLYNTLTDKKELFAPLDSNCITMYVCGSAGSGKNLFRGSLR